LLVYGKPSLKEGLCEKLKKENNSFSALKKNPSH
jgi:hypothetical protein